MKKLLLLALASCATPDIETDPVDAGTLELARTVHDRCDHLPRGRYGECCAAIDAGCPLPAACMIPEVACVKYYCGPLPSDWPMVCWNNTTSSSP